MRWRGFQFVDSSRAQEYVPLNASSWALAIRANALALADFRNCLAAAFRGDV